MLKKRPKKNQAMPFRFFSRARKSQKKAITKLERKNRPMTIELPPCQATLALTVWLSGERSGASLARLSASDVTASIVRSSHLFAGPYQLGPYLNIALMLPQVDGSVAPGQSTV